MATVKSTIEQQLDAANVKLLQASVDILELTNELAAERADADFLRARVRILELKLDRARGRVRVTSTTIPALLRPQAG